MSESPDCSPDKTPAPRAAEDLVFPDWSGMLPNTPRMPKDKWLEYCRSNLPKIRAQPGYAELRRLHGISVEFEL